MYELYFSKTMDDFFNENEKILGTGSYEALKKRAIAELDANDGVCSIVDSVSKDMVCVLTKDESGKITEAEVSVVKKGMMQHE